MTISTPIDLSQLPVPDVIEVIDFETLFAERKADLIAKFPPERQAEIAATLELESEPMTAGLQENTYREMLLRQRINDAARAVMLAYAKRADLDNLAALVGVVRQVIQAADPEQGIELVMESDEDLRKRVLLAPHSFSTAGPAGEYISKALGAAGAVRDAAVKSPTKGQVLLTVLSHNGDGTAPPALLDAVNAALSAEHVRPLTDELVIQSATIVPYQVEAKLFMSSGPDSAVAMAEAKKRLQAYVESCRKIGRLVAMSGIDAALHVAGVERVQRITPTQDIVTTDVQAPYCTAMQVTVG